MNEPKITGDAQSCEKGITGVTELNGDADATFNHLTTALHNAIRAVRIRLLTEGINAEDGAMCPRCAARVWFEDAEDGAVILVNSDGSPHSDACP